MMEKEFGFFDLFFISIFALISVCIAEIITVPLVGSLVRFRANYAPKGLQLDAEGGAQPHAGPVITSYFAMLARVHRLEGWKGHYKGYMPNVLSTLIVTLFLWVYIGTSTPGGTGRYNAPSASPVQLLLYSVFLAIIGLPATILINRAITTPYLLPWFAPRYALQRLFTPTELRKPWLLYLTPGLLAAKVLHLGYIILFMGTFRALLLPSLGKIASGTYDRSDGVPQDFTTIRIFSYVFLTAISTIILCPLEVIMTRLSLQRNHRDSDHYEAAQGEAVELEPESEFAGSEDVIGLRDESDPYVGLQDSARRMINEEGWRALYRGWWITLLGGVLSGFA
ncbi:hypothetical protein M422DRAFT_225557 [Sphaerobolus stellatus SS14]|nr:hypothetical protein M422DRAFT_225557 [Sphaerobolus stellatus SS14]